MKISFIKEIKRCIFINDFFCVQIYAQGGVVLNVKKIIECEAQTIKVITQDKRGVTISGEKLAITKVCDGDLFFTGQIKGVNIE